MRFLIITPTRNEAAHIETTITCMTRQSLQPVKWVVVDDGSSDGTGEILHRHADRHPFIEPVSLPDRGYRKPGQGVVEVFYAGYEKAKAADYDVIAKFDADLEFPSDALARISDAFQNDPKLGITGGTIYESKRAGGAVEKVLVPRGFVRGPTKFYRKACFEDIGGLIPRAGWDGVDIIKANMKGWKTGELEDLRFVHLKPTGTADGEGLRRACEKYGDVSYYMGGYLWYFALRVVGRSMEHRNPLVGYYMIRGYLRSLLRRIEREPAEFRGYLRKVQIINILEWIKTLTGRMAVVKDYRH